MVKAAEDGCDSAEALDWAMERGVFGQRSVSSEFVVITGIGGEDPAQVRVAQDHDMVQALSPDRANESFDVSILPGRSRRGWSVPNAHGSEASRYGMAVRGVSVPDEVSGCLIPGEGLGDLAGDPFGGRIGGDVDPHLVASLKLDDHQSIEQLEANGRHDKHINGGDVRRVIAEKRLPSLRWRPASAYHVLGDSRLGDLEVQLEQLPVDARRSPQWVRPAHFPNEGTQLS